MLKKEREITNAEEILDLLKRCNTLRIAFNGEEYPYVVPVSFGVETFGKNATIYFHGAKRGMKSEYIKSCPNICVEGDIFYKTEEIKHGITTRYESVIGFGYVEEVDGEEAVKGLKAICTHYGYSDYSVDNCKSLSMTGVYKINIKSMSGKRNLPKE